MGHESGWKLGSAGFCLVALILLSHLGAPNPSTLLVPSEGDGGSVSSFAHARELQLAGDSSDKNSFLLGKTYQPVSVEVHGLHLVFLRDNLGDIHVFDDYGRHMAIVPEAHLSKER